jgi:hypothetical protein
MTVGELITKLAKVDPNLPVAVIYEMFAIRVDQIDVYPLTLEPGRVWAKHPGGEHLVIAVD